MRNRILGPSGLRVSEMCLGTMTFGTGWGWGADEAECRRIYEGYRGAGGNFIDTADIYTGGQSEEIVGRLIASERDSVVVATKFTLPTDPADPNSAGSHRKSLRRSLDASLRRLGTDHVDLLWVHAWDRCTPAEETLRALDDAVRSGRVLAVGVSNTPAWVVSRSQAIAELRGWSSFCAVQVEYSLVARTPERELLPMAAALGLSATAWSPLGRGLLAGKTTRADGRALTAEQERTYRAVAEMAASLGVTAAQLSLAWLLGRGVIPVLGASRRDQVDDNLGAAGVMLDEAVKADLAELDGATRVDLGYPHEFLRDRTPALDRPAEPG